MKYPSDDSGMTLRDKNRNGGGNSNGNKLPAFMPGQLGALAGQLNAGFGGGFKDWKADLRNTYNATPSKPFNFGGGNGGGQNQPVVNDPRNPGGNQTGGGFDPSRPRNAMMPMQSPMQMPQQGLLSASMQMQQPNRGLLGDMPPEVLAFLSSNTRR